MSVGVKSAGQLERDESGKFLPWHLNLLYLKQNCLFIKLFCVEHCCSMTTHVTHQLHPAAFRVQGWPASRSLLCAGLLVSGAQRIKSLWENYLTAELRLCIKIAFRNIGSFQFNFLWIPFTTKLVTQLFLNYILQLNLSDLMNVKAQTPGSI